MQSLKFKIKHEFKEDILNYQREYSSLLHICFEFIKNDQTSHTLFDYKYKDSALMKKLKLMNNVELMNSWMRQCAISEAYLIFQTFNFKQEKYNEKIQRKNELNQKENLLKFEKKELRKLQKLKEPKIVFGRKKAFY